MKTDSIPVGNNSMQQKLENVSKIILFSPIRKPAVGVKCVS